jgi:hypothetical protein
MVVVIVMLTCCSFTLTSYESHYPQSSYQDHEQLFLSGRKDFLPILKTSHLYH